MELVSRTVSAEELVANPRTAARVLADRDGRASDPAAAAAVGLQAGLTSPGALAVPHGRRRARTGEVGREAAGDGVKSARRRRGGGEPVDAVAGGEEVAAKADRTNPSSL